MRLVVGLGNPGEQYEGTRHNVGFEVVNLLAARHGISVRKHRFRAVFGDGLIAGERVILARPMTYMNLSGEAVLALSRFHRVEATDIIVILDEVALPVGQLRLRYQGSAGGHNGLADVLTKMQTTSIPRIRVGVGSAEPGRLIGHVLSRFAVSDLPIMDEAYVRAADAVECALSDGFETAMNQFNVQKIVRPCT